MIETELFQKEKERKKGSDIELEVHLILYVYKNFKSPLMPFLEVQECLTYWNKPQSCPFGDNTLIEISGGQNGGRQEAATSKSLDGQWRGLVS